MPPVLPDPLFIDLQEAVAGRYSLERELGRGGMGVVYLARDVALDRAVAIKLLPPDRAGLPGVRERFLREARTAARLSHPNIVPIHAVEDTGRLVFFVMAYVAGPTLAERIATGGPLPAADARRILRDVAWALGYAHQQGVVHRDVKAENILLEIASRRTLVTDFGIAQTIGGDDDAPLAGTVPYMSPEQAAGHPVDGRSDGHSLGVVGYLALSGRLPWPAETREELQRRWAAGPPEPLATVAPHVPRALARAVERCLARDPAARFQSAEDLAGALDHLAAEPGELPAPLRVWLTGDDRSRTGVMMWTLGTGLPTILFLLTTLRFEGFPWVPAIVLGLASIAPAVLFGVGRINRTRQILAAGYTRNDLILAIRRYTEREREELAFAIGAAPSRLGRWIRRAAWGSLGLAVTAALALVVVPDSWHAVKVMSWLFLLAAGTSLGAALAGSFIPGRAIPSRERRTWRERLWNGSLGRVLAAVAGWRLGRRAVPELTLHRPTEIALGEASEALFRALPEAHRRHLADLPAQVERLATEAVRIRAELQEVDDLIERGAPATLDHGAAADRGGPLAAARATLAGQLRETVVVLEALRVGLLRLHAGTADPASLTTDLVAARALASRLDGLNQASGQVQGLLEVSISTG